MAIFKATFYIKEETGSTIEANAILKAKAIYDSLLQDCFAEDTGLEVEALNNAPGVHTARYAGEQKNTEDNINLLLKNLTDSENRNAQFRTVICLILEGQQYLFEGKLIGKIVKVGDISYLMSTLQALQNLVKK